MLEFLRTIGLDFWGTLSEMSPYLLFGFLIAGLLSVCISPQRVEQHLGGGGFWQVFKASLFGVPLPLCSCGVIPVSMSLHKHGASKGATVSFLLSTPQTGVDSILVTYSLMGPIFAIFRPLAAFVTGVFGGCLVNAVENILEKLGQYGQIIKFICPSPLGYYLSRNTNFFSDKSSSYAVVEAMQ